MTWYERIKMSHEFTMTYSDTVSKKEYLMDFVFHICTYDTEQAEAICKKVMEVAEAITNRTTFEYIQDDANYTWYLMVCNMPFFADRLEWGTSIRGAWWEVYKNLDSTMKFQSCGLYDDDGQQQVEWEFTKAEWEEFVLACVKYGREVK